MLGCYMTTYCMDEISKKQTSFVFDNWTSIWALKFLLKRTYVYVSIHSFSLLSCPSIHPSNYFFELIPISTLLGIYHMEEISIKQTSLVISNWTCIWENSNTSRQYYEYLFLCLLLVLVIDRWLSIWIDGVCTIYAFIGMCQSVNPSIQLSFN